MSEFDREYAVANGLLFGEEPSLYLDLFLRSERIPPGPALDTGCGDGRNSLFLARCGFEVTGIDLSEVAIARLREEARRQGLKLNLLVGDVRTYPYPPNRYGLVVANTVLDHLEKQDGNLLIEAIQETVIPGGYLFVSGFTTEDPGYQGVTAKSSTAEHVKRYFYPGELRDLFTKVTVIRYHEESFLDTKHGLPHYHSIARLMARRCEGVSSVTHCDRSDNQAES